MMTIRETILRNWNKDIPEFTQIIDVLPTEYPAWTIRLEGGYGVAIPYVENTVINENFAGAKLKSIAKLHSGERREFLILITDSQYIKEPFSSLCEALIDPGEEGEKRRKITKDPLEWWREWKELLGNKNIDDRIYDVLGELCALKYAISTDKEAQWNGPEGASYDIETESRFIEVKSSLNRYKTEVTISSEFQLNPPEKPLHLVFCRFEFSVNTGTSIDSILEELGALGYNKEFLNDKLEFLGLEKGMSARRKRFLLHDMLLYIVNENFPRVTKESFVGGVMPPGINKFSYVVDLSGLTPIQLLHEANATNDIQNN